MTSLRLRFASWVLGADVAALSVSAPVRDGDPIWAALTGRPHDYDPSLSYQLYQDALEAWRKNPIAWRIIGITTDFVVGDQIRITSANRRLQRFIESFWNHPKNLLDLRLEAMCDELSRAGDVFIVLFRNRTDRMSYVRFVTKDEIVKIETADNDWETELVYHQRMSVGIETKRWLSPHHPDANGADAVMLHYSVNRPLGALLGEGDLTTMLPWLQRYSRMLDDRVRLHWAAKAFLWLVTVPSNKVQEKQRQYASAPEAGSVIVKDDSERWETSAPNLQASDASHDLKAVRMMIDAGSGYPGHWRGEAGDANLATATAMQGPTERHLARRQKYFVYMLQDLIFCAWQRSGQAPASMLKARDYRSLFIVEMADISRADNEALARAARNLAQAVYSLVAAPNRSRTLNRLLLRLVFKFAGEPQHPETIEDILDEIWDSPVPAGAVEAAEEFPTAPGGGGLDEEQDA